VADKLNQTIRKIPTSGTQAGVVSTVVGVAGLTGFTAGVLPGGLASPYGVAISGTSLFITTGQGVAFGNECALKKLFDLHKASTALAFVHLRRRIPMSIQTIPKEASLAQSPDAQSWTSVFQIEQTNSLMSTGLSAVFSAFLVTAGFCSFSTIRRASRLFWFGLLWLTFFTSARC